MSPPAVLEQIPLPSSYPRICWIQQTKPELRSQLRASFERHGIREVYVTEPGAAATAMLRWSPDLVVAVVDDLGVSDAIRLLHSRASLRHCLLFGLSEDLSIDTDAFARDWQFDRVIPAGRRALDALVDTVCMQLLAMTPADEILATRDSRVEHRSSDAVYVASTPFSNTGNENE